jgi:hypothetical protein
MLMRNAFLHCLLGFSALLVGLLFYLSSSPSQSLYVQGLFSIKEALFPDLPGMLGPFRGAFPEFIHPFAFSLIGIGLGVQTRRGRILICLLFGGINLVFESAQYFGAAALGLGQNTFEGIPILENSWNYFQNGTFSQLDLVAIVLGSFSAFAVSEFIQSRSRKNVHETVG